MPGQQTHLTPDEFKLAVEARFGPLVIDLAASQPNICEEYISEGLDTFSLDWGTLPLAQAAPGRVSNMWLNPPFSGGVDAKKINPKKKLKGWRGMTPWMRKCAAFALHSTCRDRRIICLVQTAVSAAWWRTCVRGTATINHLSPRLTFVGESSGHQRDLSLLIFEPFVLGGEGIWRWKDEG